MFQGIQACAEENRPRMDQVALAHVPGHPLMTLPGMRSFPSAAVWPDGVLPEPLITGVINIPNPFDSRKAGLEGQTHIAYRLERDVPVTVTLYDLLGFRVRRWSFAMGENGGRQGVNNFFWDGTDGTGRKVSKGGYLAQIEIELPGTVVTTIRKIGVTH